MPYGENPFTRLLEENYFYSQMHGILIEGDGKSWYESGGVGDITIKFVNELFVDCSAVARRSSGTAPGPILRLVDSGRVRESAVVALERFVAQLGCVVAP